MNSFKEIKILPFTYNGENLKNLKLQNLSKQTSDIDYNEAVY